MYFGEIANYGDTVHIIKEPNIVVADYVRGKQLQTQALDDEEDTLVVDQAKYWQFAVDDIERKQAHVNWEGLATSGGAYALKNSYDQSILLYMKQQVSSSSPDMVFNADAAAGTGLGSSSESVDLGHASGEATPLQLMSRLARLLDEQDIPEEGRWFVAAPDFWEVMADENSKLMGVDFTGDSASRLRNGRITDGMIRGFNCYKTNNLPATTTAGGLVMCGHMSSTATASHMAQSEVMRSENFFGDKVRGLHVYGRKTLRPEAMALAYYTID